MCLLGFTVLRTGSLVFCSSQFHKFSASLAGGAETFVPAALGITGLIVTFFTKHEYGIVRKIPMIGHLWVDGFAGILRAASPWIFGFADTVWIPHVFLGVTEFVASLVTKTVPSDTVRGAL